MNEEYLSDITLGLLSPYGQEARAAAFMASQQDDDETSPDPDANNDNDDDSQDSQGNRQNPESLNVQVPEASATVSDAALAAALQLLMQQANLQGNYNVNAPIPAVVNAQIPTAARSSTAVPLVVPLVPTDNVASAKSGRFKNLGKKNVARYMPVTFSIEQREELQNHPSEIIKVKERAVAPLSVLFSFDAAGLDGRDINTKFLKSSFQFTQIVKELEDRLRDYSMIDVFEIYPIINGLPDETAQPINLLHEYYNISYQQVRDNTRLSFEGGTEVTCENLSWSAQLLMNLVHADMKDRVVASLTRLPAQEQGGPTVFHIITQLIIADSKSLSHHIITHLNDLRISSTANEDVEEVVAIIYGAIRRLGVSYSVPPNIAVIIYNITQTSSVFRFREHFEIKKSMGSPILDDYNSLLEEMVRVYRELVQSGRWKTTNKKGAAYLAADPGDDKKQGKKKNFKLGKGKKNDKKKKEFKKVDRTPPKQGESTTRKNEDGTVEYWCSHEKCQRWGNHPRSDHEQWYKHYKAMLSKQHDYRQSPSQGEQQGERFTDPQANVTFTLLDSIDVDDADSFQGQHSA